MAELTNNGTFFNNVGEDIRQYTADDFTGVVNNIVTNGVCSPDDLKTLGSGFFDVSVSAGACFINGFSRVFATATNITVQPNTEGYIVAELSLEPERRNIVIKAVTGSVLTQNSVVWQLPLATYTASDTEVSVLLDVRVLSVPKNAVEDITGSISIHPSFVLDPNSSQAELEGFKVYKTGKIVAFNYFKTGYYRNIPFQDWFNAFSGLPKAVISGTPLFTGAETRIYFNVMNDESKANITCYFTDNASYTTDYPYLNFSYICE